SPARPDADERRALRDEREIAARIQPAADPLLRKELRAAAESERELVGAVIERAEVREPGRADSVRRDLLVRVLRLPDAELPVVDRDDRALEYAGVCAPRLEFCGLVAVQEFHKSTAGHVEVER